MKINKREKVIYSPILRKHDLHQLGFLGGSEVKASASNAGNPGSIPGSGRSPGEGNGSPLQYSSLENPMDGGAWWATVHEVAMSRTRLSNFTSFHFTLSLTQQIFTDCTLQAKNWE